MKEVARLAPTQDPKLSALAAKENPELAAYDLLLQQLDAYAAQAHANGEQMLYQVATRTANVARNARYQQFARWLRLKGHL